MAFPKVVDPKWFRCVRRIGSAAKGDSPIRSLYVRQSFRLGYAVTRESFVDNRERGESPISSVTT
jgi:hypothetical protein